jgi:hypothetical protein
MDLTTLVAYAFIELNKINEVRKIYLRDLYVLNKILKEEALNNEIEYIERMDSTRFYELKFNYSTFFNVYEDDDGFVITLANGIEPINIENYFKISKNKILLDLSNKIDLNEIFNISKKLKKI